MKNTKKLISVVCTLAIMTGLLSGCGNSTKSAAPEVVAKEEVAAKDVVVDIFQFKV